MGQRRQVRGLKPNASEGTSALAYTWRMPCTMEPVGAREVVPARAECLTPTVSR